MYLTTSLLTSVILHSFPFVAALPPPVTILRRTNIAGNSTAATEAITTLNSTLPSLPDTSVVNDATPQIQDLHADRYHVTAAGRVSMFPSRHSSGRFFLVAGIQYVLAASAEFTVLLREFNGPAHNQWLTADGNQDATFSVPFSASYEIDYYVIEENLSWAVKTLWEHAPGG